MPDKVRNQRKQLRALNRGNWGHPKGEDLRLAHKPIRNADLDGEPFEKRPYNPPGKKRTAKKPWALQHRLKEEFKDTHWTAGTKYLDSWCVWRTQSRFRREADANRSLASFRGRTDTWSSWYEYRVVNTEEKS